MNYDREDDYLQRTSRDNSGTGVEQLQPSMEGDLYKSVVKQLQFIVKNNTCINKQIQKTTKESEVMNNKNMHAYMQAAVNVIFTQMHAKKGIKIFGERGIAAMIK